MTQRESCEPFHAVSTDIAIEVMMSSILHDRMPLSHPAVTDITGAWDLPKLRRN